MMAVVGWVMKAMPLGVFALCAVFASRLGSRATGVIVFYIALVSGILLVATLLLYPVTAILGRVSLREFARASAPAQVVAVSTRSSLASLPAMVEGGRQHLALSEIGDRFRACRSAWRPSSSTTGSPASSGFSSSRTCSTFRSALRRSRSFLTTQFLLSFSAAGIPGAGSVRSLPAFLVAGVPIEGVLILNAVDAIPDIFATLANVTADMSAATILSRKERARGAAEAVSTVATP